MSQFIDCLLQHPLLKALTCLFVSIYSVSVSQVLMLDVGVCNTPRVTVGPRHGEAGPGPGGDEEDEGGRH